MKLFDIFKSKRDYSSLTSEQKRKLIEKGELKPLYLIALRFGGSDGMDNMVYAPAAAVDLKNKIDDELEEFMNQGRAVKGYRCIPSYKGKSGIPTRIVIQAFIDGFEQFVRDINIW
jgi:hypothetical protein